MQREWSFGYAVQTLDGITSEFLQVSEISPKLEFLCGAALFCLLRAPLRFLQVSEIAHPPESFAGLNRFACCREYTEDLLGWAALPF